MRRERRNRQVSTRGTRGGGGSLKTMHEGGVAASEEAAVQIHVEEREDLREGEDEVPSVVLGGPTRWVDFSSS